PYHSALLIATRDDAPVAVASLALEGATRVEPATMRTLFGATSVAATGPSPPASGALPPVSVIVTTCKQPDSVIETVASLLACEPPPLEVIVVENRPVGSPVGTALRERFGGDQRVRYVEEHRAGLSWARNAGIAVAHGEIVAVTDDDVLVDRRWLEWIGRAFASEPDVACVTGLILPGDLETESQVFIEQFAGFGKGFERRVFRLSTPTSPLSPFAAGEYGSGASTAIRRSVMWELGGFDRDLGAGTLARGGEDLDLFIRVLLAGHAIVYEPAAIIWHRHPDTTQHLRREIFGYGIGLSAMITKQMASGQALAVLRRIPRAIRFLRDPTSRKNVRKGDTYDRRYDWIERAGIAYGPVAYFRSRMQQRRARQAEAVRSASAGT
ncbi:MAG: glycosyltransferase, partial [Solirubrobacteraceae bacterium]